LVGTSLRASVDYRLPQYEAPTFILVGNEAQGLPTAYEDACDVRVKIPMLGKADSLNAAMATVVMAYEVLRQHLPADAPQASDGRASPGASAPESNNRG
jgi:TrmH family RNA methyltransferase